MKRQQFYHVEFRSEFLYREDIKVKVDSKKALKEWIKSDMEDMLREFKNPYHGMSQEQREEQDRQIKKIYKRIVESPMYHDTEKGRKNVGVTYSKEFLPSEEYMQEKEDFGYGNLMTYWCHRIPRKELEDYAGFDEL